MEQIQIATPRGPMSGWLARPTARGPAPVVIMLHDIARTIAARRCG